MQDMSFMQVDQIKLQHHGRKRVRKNLSLLL